MGGRGLLGKGRREAGIVPVRGGFCFGGDALWREGCGLLGKGRREAGIVPVQARFRFGGGRCVTKLEKTSLSNDVLREPSQALYPSHG